MTIGKSLLQPFTLPYGAWVGFRAWAYHKGIFRRRHLNGTVISVGNLTTGGTGKTPMVCWLTQRLLADGKSVGVLTRGYRGRSAADAAKVERSRKVTSDEVEMLKARLGDRVFFGVGADRFRTGQELAQQGVPWFVLDDGFQHMQLARDADIVLIDATNPFGGGNLLPAGRLREPKSALARADLIVITRSSRALALEAAIRRDSASPIFYSRVGLDSIYMLRDGHPEINGSKVREQKLFAFCGIGNPAAFLSDLRDWGITLVGNKFFRDHHRYTQSDAQEIEAEARSMGADALICTEKDIFNLTDVRWEQFEVMYCRISLRIDREEEFWNAILAAVESRPRLKEASS